MSTIPYAAPTIGPAGLTVSLYPSILAYCLAAYQNNYGSTTYLGISAADYQQMSVFSLLINDAMSLGQLIYNNRSPATAVGSGFDSIFKLNGGVRQGASSSSVVLNLSGAPGAVIANGLVQDSNQIYWAISSPAVTLNSMGQASVSAVCQTPGAISIGPGLVTTMVNQQAGWTAVTNPAAATVGAAIESDSHARARQAISVALPSNTLLQGTIAGIEAIPGVGRNQCIENPSGATDAYGNPPHSLACVVELLAATPTQVANVIFLNRGIGCQTFSCATTGTTAVTINIPVPGSSSGLIFPCNFATPLFTGIFVSVTITTTMSGYLTTYPLLIKAALASYLGALQIGETVTRSALFAIAMSCMPNILLPAYSITALFLGTSASPTGTADISMLFGQVATAGTFLVNGS
jgi:Baseplate J-like protein